MSDVDLIKLYSKRILGLASDIPHSTRLESSDSTVTKRSPLCGSTITVDIKLTDDKITEFGQEVKACALGQASASVLGHAIIGLSTEEIQKGRDQLSAMLKENGDIPDIPFNDLVVLSPAKEYKNRHASILLAWDAVLQAIKETKNPT